MNCILSAINSQYEAERAWNVFIQAKLHSLENPDDITAQRRATRLHLEFMDAFIAWTQADEKVAA